MEKSLRRGLRLSIDGIMIIASPPVVVACLDVGSLGPKDALEEVECSFGQKMGESVPFLLARQEK